MLSSYADSRLKCRDTSAATDHRYSTNSYTCLSGEQSNPAVFAFDAVHRAYLITRVPWPALNELLRCLQRHKGDGTNGSFGQLCSGGHGSCERSDKIRIELLSSSRRLVWTRLGGTCSS